MTQVAASSTTGPALPQHNSVYSCYTTDPEKMHGGRHEYTFQDGYMDINHSVFGRLRVPRLVQRITEWLPIQCGKLEQVGYTDLNCAGCALNGAGHGRDQNVG